MEIEPEPGKRADQDPAITPPGAPSSSPKSLSPRPLRLRTQHSSSNLKAAFFSLLLAIPFYFAGTLNRGELLRLVGALMLLRVAPLWNWVSTDGNARLASGNRGSSWGNARSSQENRWSSCGNAGRHGEIAGHHLGMSGRLLETGGRLVEIVDRFAEGEELRRIADNAQTQAQLLQAWVGTSGRFWTEWEGACEGAGSRARCRT